MPKFKCLKCGSCCRRLLNKVDFGTAGLFLLPEEVKLFPRDKVYPLYGFGVKGRSRPRPAEIGMYQYGENVCVHIGEDNRCKIYDKRPLACKAFPLELTVASGWAHRECTEIRNILKEGEFARLDEIFEEPEIQANITLNRKVRDALNRQPTSAVWGFDLKTKKWKRIKIPNFSRGEL